eukprot:scaffold318568_cov33-Tisochrysis_lutea.AAC.1
MLLVVVLLRQPLKTNAALLALKLVDALSDMDAVQHFDIGKYCTGIVALYLRIRASLPSGKNLQRQRLQRASTRHGRGVERPRQSSSLKSIRRPLARSWSCPPLARSPHTCACAWSSARPAC